MCLKPVVEIIAEIVEARQKLGLIMGETEHQFLQKVLNLYKRVGDYFKRFTFHRGLGSPPGCTNGKS